MGKREQRIIPETAIIPLIIEIPEKPNCEYIIPAKIGDIKPITLMPIKLRAVPLPSLPLGTLSIVAAVIIGITEKKNMPNKVISITNPNPSSNIRKRNKYI